MGGIAAGTCYFQVKESDFIITWQLEGAPVLRHDSNDYSSKVVGRHTSTIGENGRVAELSIADITFEDSGTYTCAKSYLVEGLPEEYKWILHVQGNYDFSVCPFDQLNLIYKCLLFICMEHSVLLMFNSQLINITWWSIIFKESYIHKVSSRDNVSLFYTVQVIMWTTSWQIKVKAWQTSLHLYTFHSYDSNEQLNC